MARRSGRTFKGFGPGIIGGWKKRTYLRDGTTIDDSNYIPSDAKKVRFFKRAGSDGGVSFQFPPGWDDGSGKIRHVESGPLKGRVYFTSRKEAKEVAARYAAKSGDWIRYDPD